MVHGLPEGVNRLLIKDGFDLAHAWEQSGVPYFNDNPDVAGTSYEQEINFAGLPGVIAVLQELLEATPEASA
jgi:hypothetical protein